MNTSYMYIYIPYTIGLTKMKSTRNFIYIIFVCLAEIVLKQKNFQTKFDKPTLTLCLFEDFVTIYIKLLFSNLSCLLLYGNNKVKYEENSPLWAQYVL